jgi:protein-export membrane protein SecD
MIRNVYTRLVIILIIMALALWIDLNDNLTINNPFTGTPILNQNVATRLGLDLRGGLQVLLEADLPEDADVDAESMETARTIMENRTNALGVSENVLQLAGERRIVGEFPGLENTDEVLGIIQQTGLLEFVDTGDINLPEGSIIRTDFATGSESETPQPTNGETPPTVYPTIMTGRDLQLVQVSQDQLGQYVIQFDLTRDGAEVFAEHTAANVGRFLTIVLDKRVISSPVINSAIPDGQGIIQGSFTAESANALAVQLRYGSLPVPLKVVETRIIGPTLGEDSLNRSIIAGLVGLTIVILFMGIYYRLPGHHRRHFDPDLRRHPAGGFQADWRNFDPARYRGHHAQHRLGIGRQHPGLRTLEGRTARR